jgi:hypothetical protein
MSTNRSNDRVSLCAFKFADGRKCRMPRRNGHPYLCAFHARKEAQTLAGEKAGTDIAYYSPATSSPPAISAPPSDASSPPSPKATSNPKPPPPSPI